MTIKEMNNNELLRHYAFHLKQIDNDYKIKKEFEDEMKNRFNEGKLNDEEGDGKDELNS